MYADGSAVSAGLGSLPVGFGVIVGAILVSFLIWALKGNIRLVMVLACCVMTAGNGAMASAHVGDNLIYLPVCLACLGVGAVIIPNQIIASIVCPDDLIGSVTALTISVRVIGGAIAYAIYYNILRQKFTLNAIVSPSVWTTCPSWSAGTRMTLTHTGDRTSSAQPSSRPAYSTSSSSTTLSSPSPATWITRSAPSPRSTRPQRSPASSPLAASLGRRASPTSTTSASHLAASPLSRAASCRTCRGSWMAMSRCNITEAANR